MKKYIKTTLLFILISLMTNGIALAKNSHSKKPNVLVILIDDLGWTDLTCYGSTFYETPFLDRLATNGIRFTHSCSAHPVCSPTRAALMTGKIPNRLGISNWIHQNSGKFLPTQETTLGEAFQAAGYRTGYIGKWHLGEKPENMPAANGFDWVRCSNKGGQPRTYFYPFRDTKNPEDLTNVPDLENYKKGDFLTDALTDKAIEFLDESAKQEKPFLLYFAHYAVHTPTQGPKDLVEKYKKKHTKMFGNTPTPRIEDRFETGYRARQDHPIYAAQIESLDTNTGRLIKHLNQLGLMDNTLILFTSDNGGLSHLRNPQPDRRGNGMGPTCNLPIRSGKGWNYEGGTRIPTFFYWKGHIAPATSDLPIISMDMYPTLLELAGLPLRPKQHIDGQSLASVIMGKPPVATLKNRTLFWNYPHGHGSGHRPSAAIQKNGWKLIHWNSNRGTELYHISQDPSEKQEVSKKYPEKTKELLDDLKALIKETNKK